jgi:hypothetical protein
MLTVRVYPRLYTRTKYRDAKGGGFERAWRLRGAAAAQSIHSNMITGGAPVLRGLRLSRQYDGILFMKSSPISKRENSTRTVVAP